MSARDSESGSSTYKGGSGNAGGLGNGGIGGGMGGGNRGGGAGYNGGIGSRTGVTTGNTWRGTSAFGRPGGPAMGYGMSPAAARQAAMVAQQGILGRLRQGVPQQGVPVPVAAPPPAAVPPPQRIIGYLPGWPGTGMWWGNQAPWQNNEGMMTHQTPPQSAPPNGEYQDRVPSGVGPGNWAGQGGGPRWGRTENAPYGGVGG